MTLRSTLIADLMRDEGLKLKPYRDTVGKLTIGVGRNLDDVGISEEEAEYLLANDVRRTEAEMDRLMPWWRDLDDTRKRVLINMAFNLGAGGLAKFTQTLEAVRSGDYGRAAVLMLRSKWAGQVGDRAQRLAAMMRSGL